MRRVLIAEGRYSDPFSDLRSLSGCADWGASWQMRFAGVLDWLCRMSVMETLKSPPFPCPVAGVIRPWALRQWSARVAPRGATLRSKSLRHWESLSCAVPAYSPC
jgi:hypothetical protein